MIAALPMYERAQTRGSHDRFWHALRGVLGFGPKTLSRPKDLWSLWTAPDLLFAQTCGLPYRSQLHRKVTLVATPDYGLEDCPPGHYRSVLLMRKSAPAGHPAQAKLAYNDPLSQSGWAAAVTYYETLGVRPAALIETGSHRASAQAVASGTADIAALDAISWRLIQLYDTFASSLKVVAKTPPTPGLPFITALEDQVENLNKALPEAFATLSRKDQASLGITGFATLPAQEYLSLPIPASPSLW